MLGIAARTAASGVGSYLHGRACKGQACCESGDDGCRVIQPPIGALALIGSSRAGQVKLAENFKTPVASRYRCGPESMVH